MLEVSRIGCGVYLCILSIIDIWTRRIPLWFLAAGGAAAAAARICQTGPLDFSALAGAVTGAVFIVVSRVTREGFGYGDSLLILILGVYLGFWNLLGVLSGAFLFSALFAAALLLYKGFDRKAGYPFIPFLLVSYFLWMCGVQ
ncbi:MULTISPECIES: prepilin peptidase [Clostridia]|uniref:prepilin peptidase n=1 Tax=Clostridia TaxID=186801 RepID=UPI00067F5356|nr:MULTISPECIES: prepilin peptidase [Clostridia]